MLPLVLYKIPSCFLLTETCVKMMMNDGAAVVFSRSVKLLFESLLSCLLINLHDSFKRRYFCAWLRQHHLILLLSFLYVFYSDEVCSEIIAFMYTIADSLYDDWCFKLERWKRYFMSVGKFPVFHQLAQQRSNEVKKKSYRVEPTYNNSSQQFC